MERLAGRIILLWGWRRALVAFLAGALTVLALSPWDFPAVAFVSFPVLVWLLDGAAGPAGAGFVRRLAPAFATGWWFGFGYFVAGLWWVGNAMLVEADQFAWALPFAILALPAFLALTFGLATALAALCWRNELGRLAALGAAFGLTEWLRTFAFTGFPWNPVGQMAMPMPLLMQSSALVGPNAMNALAVFLFTLPALVSGRRFRRTGLLLGLLLAVLHAGFGIVRLSLPFDEGERLPLRIVQPSSPLDGAWTEKERDAMFARLIELSRRPPVEDMTGPELVVWPETAVPFLFTERPDMLSAIGDALDDGQMLMAGAVRAEGDADNARYYNALLAINSAGEITDAADKVHLVPFGEYVPLPGLLRMFGIEEIVRTVGGYSPAPARRLIKGPRGLTFEPLICYEIIFPGEVSADAAGADLLINLTVDTWFGDSPGPWQHLRQAQLRAVETGRPVIRAANSGISAVIDSRGRILDALALGTTGVLDADLPLAKTQALRSSSAGEISLLIIMVLAAFGCAMNVASMRKMG